VAQEDAAHGPDLLLESTGYLLARLGRESRHAWGQMLAEYGLTAHQFGVLMFLAQLGAASQQQLSLAVGVDPRNAVPIVDALQRRGLLERRPDAADRRRLSITLTGAGQAMVRQLRQAGSDLESWFLDSLSEQERTDLHATLAKLFAAVTRAGNQRPGRPVTAAR
jgi:DNA-binding MarR family transcriptional regulator